MNRVWTALLLLAAVAVAGSVGYVLAHNQKVPQAGQTPGYSASPAGASAGRTTPPPATTSRSAGGTSSSGGTHKGSTHIAFLGDNWTIGEGVSHKADETFPSLVAKALHVKDTAVGANGAGYAKQSSDGKSYADLVDKVVKSKPDIVVVSGGRNDVSDDPTTLANDAKSLFAELKSKLPHAKLVAIAPFWGDSDHPSDLTMVDSAVKAGVEAAGGTYLDLPDPLHNHSDWMADSANPNEKGNQAIADALKPELQKLL